MWHADERSCSLAAALTSLATLIELQPSSSLRRRRPQRDGQPRDCRGDSRPVQWPYTTKWTTRVRPRSLCSRSLGLPCRPSTTPQMPLPSPSRPAKTPEGRHLTNDKRRRKVRRGGGVKPGGRPGRGHQQGCETMRCIKVRTSNAEPGSNTALFGCSSMWSTDHGISVLDWHFLCSQAGSSQPKEQGGCLLSRAGSRSPSWHVLGRGGVEAGRELGRRQRGGTGVASRTPR